MYKESGRTLGESMMTFEWLLVYDILCRVEEK